MTTPLSSSTISLGCWHNDTMHKKRTTLYISSIKLIIVHQVLFKKTDDYEFTSVKTIDQIANRITFV